MGAVIFWGVVLVFGANLVAGVVGLGRGWSSLVGQSPWGWQSLLGFGLAAGSVVAMLLAYVENGLSGPWGMALAGLLVMAAPFGYQAGGVPMIAGLGLALVPVAIFIGAMIWERLEMRR